MQGVHSQTVACSVVVVVVCCCDRDRACVVQVFEAAPQDVRGVPAKKAAPDYFL